MLSTLASSIPDWTGHLTTNIRDENKQKQTKKLFNNLCFHIWSPEKDKYCKELQQQWDYDMI